MSKVLLELSVSLDGFVTGPDAALEQAREAAGSQDVLVRTDVHLVAREAHCRAAVTHLVYDYAAAAGWSGGA